jgi:serine phosphatase RsbU (regulator of sigma subunit)/ligand-binding sensor protein
MSPAETGSEAVAAHDRSEVTAAPSPHADHSLTEFLRSATLQEIQDGYTAVTGLEAAIVDANGQPVTSPSEAWRLTDRELALRQTLTQDHESPLRRRFEVPIVADGQRLGAIVLTGRRRADQQDKTREQAFALAEQFNVEPDRRPAFADAVGKLATSRESEAVRFVYLLADAIAQVCRQDIELQHRIDEMSTLYRLSTLLAQQRDLPHVLNTIAESAAESIGVKAASIRLFNEDGDELLPKAVYNLSPQYLSKGPLLIERSVIDQAAMSGEVVYVEDMATDPRTIYPEDARREGLSSILVSGMVYRGKKIGVMRIYSEQRRTFSEFEKHLLHAIAQLAAAAIENTRLDEEQKTAQRMRDQVKLAADVQRRLLPDQAPEIHPFDVAGRYDPCFELGGDFYDFIPFESTLGVVVGDVVGKGIAASLLMASVRAALRAHVEDVYDLDQVMAKVNAAMSRDTRDNEFATVFYGTLDARNLRLTYCSAGHDPALLYRDGSFTDLTIGGTVLGVDPRERFDKGLIDLKPDDVIFIYTDGVPDATNFNGEKFGRQRIRRAIEAMAHESARRIVDHVLWEVRRFMGLNRRPDDMTLVAIRVTDKQVNYSI